jgi:hypothetical protein
LLDILRQQRPFQCIRQSNPPRAGGVFDGLSARRESERLAIGSGEVSVISQNRPEIIEIKAAQKSATLIQESNTAPWNLEEPGSMMDVPCPQSEPAKQRFTTWPIRDGRSDEWRTS